MVNDTKKFSTDFQGLRKLHRLEVVEVFIQTLTDIYNVKSHLLQYLPKMSQKAHLRELRIAILDTGIDIHSQLLRLDMVIAMLKSIRKVDPDSETQDLNLTSYIKSSLRKSEDYKTDVALLTHLLMIEGIQITAFTLMHKMSSALRHNTISDLIHTNLLEAVNNNLVLNHLLKDYLG